QARCNDRLAGVESVAVAKPECTHQRTKLILLWIAICFCWQVRSVGFLQHSAIFFLGSKYGTICLFVCLRTATNGGLHEIIGRQEVDRPGWPQDEREPRGCVLAGAKGDRGRA